METKSHMIGLRQKASRWFSLRWNPDCNKFFVELTEKHEQPGSAGNEPPTVIEPSLKCPASGPPADWLRRHGLTPSDKCGACRFLREKGARMSKVHSKFCCARYESWLQSESTKASAPVSKSSTYPEDQGSAGDGSAPPEELPSSDNQQKRV